MPAQTPAQDGLDQGVSVDVGVRTLDSAFGRVWGNPRAPDPLIGLSPASLVDGRIGSCDGFGDASIVDRALALQALDGGVDVLRRVSLADEPQPDLGFGQLASREQREAGDVGGVSVRQSV